MAKIVKLSSPARFRLLHTKTPTVVDTSFRNNKKTIDNSKCIGWNEALPFGKIPGPRSVPLVGNMWRFFPRIGDLYGIQPHDMQYKFYKQYGDIVCLRGIFGRNPIVMLFNPEEIEKVYRNEGPWPIRNFVNSIKYYKKVHRKDIFHGTGGLGAEDGEEWARFRSQVNPIFLQPKAIKQYVSKINEVATELVDNIRFFSKNNSKCEMPNNFSDELYKYSLEVVALIALDRRLGALNHSENVNLETQNLINLTKEAFGLMYRLDILPSLWRWYSTSDWKRYVYILDFLVKQFGTYINEEVLKIEKYGFPSDELSIFQKLIQIDPKVAHTMTLEMFLAGTDTTGKTLGAGLYYLASNKESQDALRKELLHLLPSKDTPLTNEILSEAQYLKAVVKEITRLATVAVGNVRATVKDMVICGYQIPEGTDIMNAHLCISTRTNKYFPQAESFMPERWLRNDDNNELSSKNVNPFVSLPFGFGPRSCIGQRFAVMEMEVALAKIIRNFVLDWHQPKMEFNTLLFYSIANPLKFQAKEVPT